MYLLGLKNSSGLRILKNVVEVGRGGGELDDDDDEVLLDEDILTNQY